jgi:PLP dependent protein
MIAENVSAIRAKICQAADRAGVDAHRVRIVAAAKGQGKEKILQAVSAEVRLIGHNYLQEALNETPPELPPDVEVHMIGHLQKNKAGKAVELFQCIQTLDNEELAVTLNRRAHGVGRTLKVMIQVNLSGEPQKSGIPGNEVERLAETVRGLASLSLQGLMTMPPFFDDPDRARPYFAQLRELRDRLHASGVFTQDMTELSMGMTGDFEVAVEEGATLVRIGTALFGPRGV